MKELISKTCEIKYVLKQNICLDRFNNWHYNLENTKIRHIQNNCCNFWTIRKCSVLLT